MNLRSIVTMGVLAACQWRGMTTGCSAANPRIPALRIHLYDLASVPDRTLQRALAEATRLFAGAGIEIAWQPGKADAPEAHMLDLSAAPTAGTEQADERAFLVVRIVGDFAPARPGMLGLSLPNARTGTHVTVIYRRIENLALFVSTAPEAILGHALAHEIGHVLLRSDKHSQTGIMKAVWGNTDYARLAAGSLYFAPREAPVMRKEASRRTILTDVARTNCL